MFVKIGKILLFCLIVLIISFNTGCDYCGNGNGNGLPQTGDIYFTAIPVNTMQPGIFWIKIDGTNTSMRQVVGSTKIFSAPSKDNKIVYTGYYLGDKYIYVASIDGSNQRVLLPDINFGYDKLYPVMSPNGKYIAVNDIRTGLWLVKNEKDVFQLSNNLCPNTIPSFSPDGTKLAYFNGFSLNSPLTVTVLNLETNPPSVIVNKQHSSGLIPFMKGDAYVTWSQDGNYICYVISEAETADVIYKGPYNSVAEDGYQIISIGAYNPVLTKDLSKVIFQARDGNIWLRSFSDTVAVKRYVNLTNDTGVVCIYPQLSQDETKLIFSKYYKDDMDDNHASMEMVEFNSDGTRKIRVLSSNVNRGFWYNK